MYWRQGARWGEQGTGVVSPCVCRNDQVFPERTPCSAMTYLINAILRCLANIATIGQSPNFMTERNAKVARPFFVVTISHVRGSLEITLYPDPMIMYVASPTKVRRVPGSRNPPLRMQLRRCFPASTLRPFDRSVIANSR